MLLSGVRIGDQPAGGRGRRGGGSAAENRLQARRTWAGAGGLGAGRTRRTGNRHAGPGHGAGGRAACGAHGCTHDTWVHTGAVVARLEASLESTLLKAAALESRLAARLLKAAEQQQRVQLRSSTRMRFKASLQRPSACRMPSSMMAFRRQSARVTSAQALATPMPARGRQGGQPLLLAFRLGNSTPNAPSLCSAHPPLPDPLRVRTGHAASCAPCVPARLAAAAARLVAAPQRRRPAADTTVRAGRAVPSLGAGADEAETTLRELESIQTRFKLVTFKLDPNSLLSLRAGEAETTAHCV
jgi:hypothetical protein